MGVFFVDELGGIGKSYLYCALIVTVKAKGKINLAIATSRIVATLLLGD